MQSKYFIIIGLFCFLQGIVAENIDGRSYASAIDGTVKFANEKVTISVLDNPDRVFNENYSIENRDALSFLLVRENEYLILWSNELLYMYNKDGRYIYKGTTRSGRMLEFISPADSYKATSSLKENGSEYSASNLSYVKSNNPWVEGKSNDGVNETITMKWKNQIYAIVIVNGFISVNKPYLYSYNNRVCDIQIVDENGNTLDFTLEDSPRPQIINLIQHTKEVKVIIKSVYKGTKWNDTCLGMIQGINHLADGFF